MMDGDEPSPEVLNSRITSLGFKEFPFNYQLDIRFYYPATSRNSIITKILDAYHTGFARMLVVGKKGTGKTSLAMMLAALLEQENKVEIRYLAPLDFSDDEAILKFLLLSISFEWQGDLGRNLMCLKESILRQHETGKPFFFIVEQRQPDKVNLTNAILHELGNISSEGQPVFHLVWLASELPLRLPIQMLPPFDDFEYLADMVYREMAEMIRFRCRVAGRKERIFTTEALRKIFNLSHGNPGLALRLCDFALYEMASDNKRLCGVKDVISACRWIYEFRWPEAEDKGENHASY